MRLKKRINNALKHCFIRFFFVKCMITVDTDNSGQKKNECITLREENL